MEKKNIGKIIISILLIAVAVVVFSPSLQGFLPENIKTGINAFIDEHFAENALAGITFAEIGAAILSLVITFAVANLVKFAIGSLKFKKHRSETLRQLLEKLLYYIVYICGAIVALSCLGVDTAAIFVSAGVLAIIVGFGAQSLIEDVITGLFIILEGEIAVGDIITIDGFRGEVKSVGLRTISIIDLGGNIRIINNSEIGSLVNLSDVTSVAVVNVPNFLPNIRKSLRKRRFIKALTNSLKPISNLWLLQTFLKKTSITQEELCREKSEFPAKKQNFLLPAKDKFQEAIL